MLAAEATHRDHAIVEQVIAELKNGPLAHLPSGMFAANAAWLVCAAIAHNLTRAAGALAVGRHARTRTATIRAQLINIPARIARSAHRQVLHLPRDWPWRGRARRTVPPRPARPPPRHRLTTRPHGPDRRPPVEEPDRPAAHHAHLPSGRFAANAAWLACAAIAHNLTRAAGTLAGGRHARTRTGTVRRQLIHTPARIAHSAHRQVLHLPQDWPWEPGLDELFRRALHDPLPTAA